MTDKVNHPSHYTSDPSGVECITITRHRSFNVGNAIKYLWRAGLKDSSPCIEDLRKAIWYIEDEIKRLEGEKEPQVSSFNAGRIADWLPPAIFRGIERENPTLSKDPPPRDCSLCAHRPELAPSNSVVHCANCLKFSRWERTNP